LSYSKVREVTRVVDLLDEQQLCRMALTATASQLGRMISSYRTATGARISQQRERSLSWNERTEGMIDFRIRLPKEEAAVLIAALTAAKDQFGAPPPAPCTDQPDDPRPSGAAGPTRAEPETVDSRGAQPEADPQVDTTPVYGYADAILDVARCFLDTAPEDRSGEDRTLVVVHVSAENLTGSGGTVASTPDVPDPTAADPDSGAAADPGTVLPDDSSQPAADDNGPDVPAGASEEADAPAGTPVGPRDLAGGRSTRPGDPAGTSAGIDDPPAARAREGVPAGTSRVIDPTCHIQGVGGIEPETARRLACHADLIGAVVDARGEVLALGRTRRLVSRAQRRALMIRDSMCQFPGCHQTGHLDAHHIVAWAAGGPTDLDNLILICRWHHTAVHEGGMTIVPAAEPSAGPRWQFVMPDGTPHQDWYDADALAHVLARQSGRRQTEHTALIESVDGFNHPDAQRIRPGWRGERFDLHECVQALFRMRPPDNNDDHDEEWEAA
jgi:hypothetical protein